MYTRERQHLMTNEEISVSRAKLICQKHFCGAFSPTRPPFAGRLCIISEKNSSIHRPSCTCCITVLEIKMTCARTQRVLRAGGVCQPSTIDGINNAKWNCCLWFHSRERERERRPSTIYSEQCLRLLHHNEAVAVCAVHNNNARLDYDEGDGGIKRRRGERPRRHRNTQTYTVATRRI